MSEIPGMVERIAFQAVCSRHCARITCDGPVGEGQCKRSIDIVRAAIAAHEAALRDAGMVIVPRDPTKAMLEAAAHDEDENEVGDIYREMVAAAHRCSTTDPESTSPVGGNVGEP